MILSSIKNSSYCKSIFLFFLILCMPCIVNAEFHTYKENNEFGLQCQKGNVCNIIYKKNKFIVLSDVSIEPSNIYLENNLYNIIYPCGTSCVNTIFFRAPNKVSGIFLNVLSTSSNGDYVAVAYKNEVLIYKVLSGVLIKKQVINKIEDVLAYYQDSIFQGNKFILTIQNNDGDDEKINIKF